MTVWEEKFGIQGSKPLKKILSKILSPKKKDSKKPRPGGFSGVVPPDSGAGRGGAGRGGAGGPLIVPPPGPRGPAMLFSANFAAHAERLDKAAR